MRPGAGRKASIRAAPVEDGAGDSLPHSATLVAPVWRETVERLGKRGIEHLLLLRVERDEHVMSRLRCGGLLRFEEITRSGDPLKICTAYDGLVIDV